MKKIGNYLAERIIIIFPVILLILVSLSIAQHWFRYLLGFFIACSIMTVMLLMLDCWEEHRKEVKVHRKEIKVHRKP